MSTYAILFVALIALLVFLIVASHRYMKNKPSIHEEFENRVALEGLMHNRTRIAETLADTVIEAMDEEIKDWPKPKDIVRKVTYQEDGLSYTFAKLFLGIGGVKVKIVHFPGGVLGYQESIYSLSSFSRHVEFDLGSICPKYLEELGELVELKDVHERNTWRKQISVLVAKLVLLNLVEKIEEYFKELKIHFADAGWVVTPELPEHHLSKMLIGGQNELEEMDYSRAVNEFTLSRKEYVPIPDTTLVNASPEKFSEFNAGQDTLLQQSRDYVHLLLGEAFGHTKNTEILGKKLDHYLSNRRTLVRGLDNTNTIWVELRGILAPRLDIYFEEGRMSVGVTIDYLDRYIDRVYTNSAFFDVLRAYLRRFLNDSLQSQYPNWEVTETGAEVSLCPQSEDERLAQAKFYYWLYDVPPHRRNKNHDTDSQA